MTMHWYVARTKLGKERYAEVALEDRGVEVYLPILRKQKARAGRRSWEPLFPCYLFARLDLTSDLWLAARSAPGVVYFVGASGEPVAVPDDFVSALMARMARINGERREPALKAGDRVIITEGPFQDMDAIFDRRVSASGRSQVLVQILSRLVRVELHEHSLKRAG